MTNLIGDALPTFSFFLYKIALLQEISFVYINTYIIIHIYKLTVVCWFLVCVTVCVVGVK